MHKATLCSLPYEGINELKRERERTLGKSLSEKRGTGLLLNQTPKKIAETSKRTTRD